ncbi:uncharacterized protein LOC129620872 isoform X1 [Bubalus kerabau]|uniref:uncharacterized protein LOC129620872 isoform X1 n=1 Tax=Bubalus carabanensis TaxID=3119969 RepID=UPI00244EED8B|nr:uncharacterized protein LOC129620872 isoform X1 [Bubalus carabanensis]
MAGLVVSGTQVSYIGQDCREIPEHLGRDCGHFAKRLDLSFNLLRKLLERKRERTSSKASHRTFLLSQWCWRSFFRVPWTARRSNQSILKETNPEYSLEGLILKLKLQCFGHLKQRTNSFEETLMLGKIEGRRRRG